MGNDIEHRLGGGPFGFPALYGKQFAVGQSIADRPLHQGIDEIGHQHDVAEGGDACRALEEHRGDVHRALQPAELGFCRCLAAVGHEDLFGGAGRVVADQDKGRLPATLALEGIAIQSVWCEVDTINSRDGRRLVALAGRPRRRGGWITASST